MEAKASGSPSVFLTVKYTAVIRHTLNNTIIIRDGNAAMEGIGLAFGKWRLRIWGITAISEISGGLYGSLVKIARYHASNPT